jgi:hypothetical protein
VKLVFVDTEVGFAENDEASAVFWSTLSAASASLNSRIMWFPVMRPAISRVSIFQVSIETMMPT